MASSLNYIEELFFNEVLSYDPNFITIMANRNSTMYVHTEVDLNLQVLLKVDLTIQYIE